MKYNKDKYWELKILLIENDNKIAEHIEKLVNINSVNCHFSVLTTESINNAVHLLKTSIFDIVILDVSVPSLHTDFNILANLNFDIPIIFLTEENENINEELINKNIYDAIPKKQLNSFKLNNAIRYSLQQHSINKQLEKKPDNKQTSLRINREIDFLSKKKSVLPEITMLIDYKVNESSCHQNTDIATNTKEILLKDQITSLNNRRQFEYAFDIELLRANRYKTNFAVSILNLDNFNSINKKFGHKTGDEILVEFSKRLITNKKPEDFIARLGGDEFVIITPNINSSTDADNIAKKIANTVNHPFFINNHNINITLSIGLSVYPSSGITKMELMKNADTALHIIKEKGGNGYLVSNVTSKSFIKDNLIKDLQSAVDKNEFFLHYMPIIELKTSKVVGIEALIRWQHPDKGIIMPGDFIPLINNCYSHEIINRWVFDKALSEFNFLKKQVNRNIFLNLNLFSESLNDNDFLKFIKKIIIQNSITTGSLHLEILESSLIGNLGKIKNVLKKLSGIGITVEIDDFGWKYLSLISLHAFPVDVLKIPKSLVANLPHDKSASAVIDIIFASANKLGKTVTAEGIETEEQKECLINKGCKFAQGFLFGKPMPINKIIEKIKSL